MRASENTALVLAYVRGGHLCSVAYSHVRGRLAASRGRDERTGDAPTSYLNSVSSGFEPDLSLSTRCASITLRYWMHAFVAGLLLCPPTREYVKVKRTKGAYQNAFSCGNMILMRRCLARIALCISPHRLSCGHDPPAHTDPAPTREALTATTPWTRRSYPAMGCSRRCGAKQLGQRREWTQRESNSHLRGASTVFFL